MQPNRAIAAAYCTLFVPLSRPLTVVKRNKGEGIKCVSERERERMKQSPLMSARGIVAVHDGTVGGGLVGAGDGVVHIPVGRSALPLSGKPALVPWWFDTSEKHE